MPDETRQETHMSQSQGTLALIATVILAVLAVRYWRTTLQLVLVAAIVLALFGAITVIHGLAPVMASHHR
jgi:hypothetical protein